MGDERLCVTEPRFRLLRSPPQAGLEPGTTISVGQRLNGATVAPMTLL